MKVSSRIVDFSPALTPRPLETDDITVHDDQPAIPTSPEANSASKQLSPDRATTHPNQDFPSATTPDAKYTQMHNQHDDTPVKEHHSSGNMEHVEAPGTPQVDGTGEESKEDSFVEAIKTRTPAKRVSRIEDSVEALDALNEEIEKVAQSIPAAESPVKVKKHQGGTSTPAKATQAKGKVAVKGRPVATKPTAPKAQANVPSIKPKPNVPRRSIRPSATDAKPPVGRGAQLKCDDTLRSPPSASKATSVAPKAAPKRVSSIHKTPFWPTKSTKAPTRSSFALPGEAISRKLKEQREERQKREEEERSKQRVFKARPVRLSQAPEVKQTAATKARLSMAKSGPVETIKSSTKTISTKPASAAASASSTGAHKRLSSLTVAKRNTQPPAIRSLNPPTANTPVKRTPSNMSVRQPSTGAPTAEDLAHQKVKGKEVFGRTALGIQEKEKSQKAKEEAAKKARIEAAERGRAASRAWAEKQAARKMAAAKEASHGEGKEMTA